MQVRKFEARSMKEALEMVKKEMGPDAIILGVRDNKKSFGLVGDMSIEITAAASDETMKRKKFAESKIRDEDRVRLQASSARQQRTFINKSVDNFHRDSQPRELPRQATRTQYIDIGDEVDGMLHASGGGSGLNPNYTSDSNSNTAGGTPAQERIRGAAQRAWTAMQVHGEWVEPAAEPVAVKSRGAGIAALYNRAAASLSSRGASTFIESDDQEHSQVQNSGPMANTVANHQVVHQQMTKQQQQQNFAQTSNALAQAKTMVSGEKAPQYHPDSTPNPQVIMGLQEEIASLRHIIRNFQNVPQQMTAPTPVVAHPGADYGLGFDMSFMFQKLTQAGVAAEITAEILNTAQTSMPAMRVKNKALVDAWVAKYLLDTTKIAGDQRHTKIHFFVGPAGAGKTSMLVKLASHAVVNERKRIAILTTDTLKVGAVEQLRIYAQILNVPFGIIRQNSDWQALESQMAQFDQVFVDSPGFSLKSDDENSFLRNIIPPAGMASAMHLVLESTAKDSDLSELGKRYKLYGFQDVIFTNLELSSQHGTIYNFMKRFETPLHSFGLGTRVPEDFEMATKERVLDLIFKLTSLKKAN